MPSAPVGRCTVPAQRPTQHVRWLPNAKAAAMPMWQSRAMSLRKRWSGRRLRPKRRHDRAAFGKRAAHRFEETPASKNCDETPEVRGLTPPFHQFDEVSPVW